MLVEWRRDCHCRGSQQRAGVTLMEVLIAMGVMTLGLLGLASLIPVARFQMVDALRLDRGAALGRSAFRDLAVRGLLRPEEWLYCGSTPAQPVLSSSGGAAGSVPRYSNPGSGGSSVTLGVPPLVPLFLDPLLVSSQATTGGSALQAMASFPYVLSGMDTSGPEYQRKDWIPRVTLRAISGVPNSQQNMSSSAGPIIGMTYAMAQRVFRGGDDIVFGIPERRGFRPRADSSLGGTMSPSPQNANLSYQALVSSAGDYSWSVLVVPNLLEALGAPVTGIGVSGGDPLATTNYTAYVIVYHKRNLIQFASTSYSDTQGRLSERAAVVQFLTSSTSQFGSTEATVYVSGVNSQAEADQALHLPNGGWLLVTGQQPWPANPSLTATVAHWYYIISADDQVLPVKGGWQRHVRLSGRDWFVRNSKNAPSFIVNNNPWGYGVISRGVVGVYEKVLSRQGNNLWMD